MPREHVLRIGIKKLAVKRGQDDREFGLRCLKAGVTGAFDSALHSLHRFDRDLAAYRRDCRVQGASRVLIYEIHSDLLGRQLADDPTGSEVADGVGLGLPRPLRRLWPWLARDPLFAPGSAELELAFESGVQAQHLGLQILGARALGSLETMRGVIIGE